MAHKQIKKDQETDQVLIIGLKTYKIIKQIKENVYSVYLIHIDERLGQKQPTTKIPFELNVSKLKYIIK